MMTSLFAMFDPSMSLYNLSWAMCLLVLFFLPSFYWFFGVLSFMVSSYLLAVKTEVDYVLASPMKGIYSVFGSIFLVVSLYNFLALFPFIFSVTSHLLVTLPFSYSLWMGIIIFCWISSVKHFLAHLIPLGTPIFLMSFMVLVEILSNLIRPLALTFRLTANMMAGHLLMGLVGSFLVMLPIWVTILGSVFQSLLVFMELGVSIIQAYVFFTLLLLYLSDSEH
uniref:ATP synthase subunit a n=1 Tax=Histiostoma blomquisti TaxID=1902798 RepID=A0A342Y122_9ACAR|nr:ATP synthase F0 subunit 6 [Histiostoma blomquisti]AOR08474.1 ATP synthase F0 subunit 6 [Histiostoma blomquisti]